MSTSSPIEPNQKLVLLNCFPSFWNMSAEKFEGNNEQKFL